MKEVDARGLSCPQPVVMFAEAAKSNQEIKVLVDDFAPLENVSRYAENHGFSVSVTEHDDYSEIVCRK